MNCKQFNKLMAAYYDHRVSDDQREALDNHLAVCVTCQKTLSDWSEVTALAKSLPKVTAPEYFETEIRRKIRAGELNAHRGSHFWNIIAIPRFSIAALGIVLIVLVAGALISQRINWSDSEWFNSRASQGKPIAAPDKEIKGPNKDLLGPIDGTPYIDVLLKDAGNEPVIMPFPPTIRVDSPYSDDYYFQNVSH